MTGSKTDLCDKDSGQCFCKEMFTGRRCNYCIFGYVGFPKCYGNDTYIIYFRQQKYYRMRKILSSCQKLNVKQK